MAAYAAIHAFLLGNQHMDFDLNDKPTRRMG
jgi:hypothetical protein